MTFWRITSGCNDLQWVGTSWINRSQISLAFCHISAMKDFEDDDAVRSTKAWVWRRRSPAKFNLLSTDAVLTRRLHSQFLIKFCICCAMASFKEFRQTLLLYYDADLITDEDFIILYELFSSRNPDFAYDSYDRFDLDNMNDDECKAEFRVRKRDLPTLAQALRIPRSFQLSQRSVVDGMEGLCMLLKRLSYPCRYGDLIYQFPFLVWLQIMSSITFTILTIIS